MSRDTFVLGALLLGLLVITGISLSAGTKWRSGVPSRAAYCLAGQTPEFQFGFGELARHLGEVMGEPTECEHGDEWTSDTRQETTTGVALYRWCTNTPTFTREHEHWMLTARGLEHWTGEGPPPSPPPRVRVAGLRQPCSE